MVFPQKQLSSQSHFPVWCETGGLSKRELFAAMAMQALISSGKVEQWAEFEIPKGYPTTLEGCAVAKADALIEALNRGVAQSAPHVPRDLE